MFYTCIDFPSEISKIIEIEEFTDTIMHDCNIAENFRARIALPLTEAVKNAILHGNKSDHCKKVHIVCQQEAEKLTFSVSDEGQGFCYKDYMDEGKTASTHGLSILRSLCDELAFQNNGSTVVFRMHLPVKQVLKKSSKAFENIKKEEYPTLITKKYESKH